MRQVFAGILFTAGLVGFVYCLHSEQAWYVTMSCAIPIALSFALVDTSGK